MFPVIEHTRGALLLLTIYKALCSTPSMYRNFRGQPASAAPGPSRAAMRQRFVAAALAFVALSVGVAPIHCALYSCHQAARHGHAGHGAGMADDAMMEHAAKKHVADADSADHGRRNAAPAAAPGARHGAVHACLCQDFERPGTMAPGSMSPLPGLLGKVEVAPHAEHEERVSLNAQRAVEVPLLPPPLPPRV